MTVAGGPTRREALRWAGGVGLTTLLVACSSRRTPAGVVSPAPVSLGPSASSAPSAPGIVGFDQLSRRLSAPLLRPGTPGYGARVQLYNPRFDATRHPAAIAACKTSEDVAACVRFASDARTPLHLRAGGHSYGGWSSGPGLVVDVSAMSSVVVDTAAFRARIGAGARLAQVYDALARKGVALAAGSCPTVGITGLTLGGGVGVLSRAYGLTCDAVRSVQVVTADGTVREVDAQHDPDLFWALRGGGGGSFGVVTAFTVEVRPAPTVNTFFLSWPDSNAEVVLLSWQDWMAHADNRLWSTCKLLADPVRVGLRALIAGTWIGPSVELDSQLSRVRRAVGAPQVAAQRRALSYGQAMLLEAGCSDESVDQCLSGALGPAKRQPFSATSSILAEPLPPAGAAAAVGSARAGLGVAHLVEGGISFDALGGKVADIAPADTAFVHRRAVATVQYTATWGSPARDPAPFDAHVRGQRASLVPWAGTSAYVNYADPAITDYAKAYWGDNYPRLQAVKGRYDPANLFTFDQAVHRTG